MAQIFVSGMAHFFMSVGGSKFHERLAHFFIDIYTSRGAWIEIGKAGKTDRPDSVAPLTGSVD